MIFKAMTQISQEYCLYDGRLGWLIRFEDPFGFIEEIFESEEDVLAEERWAEEEAEAHSISLPLSLDPSLPF